MSYDIDIFTLVSGKTLEESEELRCGGELAPLTEEARKVIRELAKAITAELSFELFESEKWISLTGVGNEVLMQFYNADHCSLSVPYARDDRATRSNFDIALKILQIMHGKAGFVAQDLQMGELITVFDEQFKTKMLEMAGYTNDSIRENLIPGTATRPKPWWQFW